MDRRGEKDAVNLASFMFPTKVKRSCTHERHSPEACGNIALFSLIDHTSHFFITSGRINYVYAE